MHVPVEPDSEPRSQDTLGEAAERRALRDALPPPADEVTEELSAALAFNRFAAANFNAAEDVTVDRYIVRRELGRGGMGVVFVAYDPVLKVQVALKLLRRAAPGAGDSEAALQLQREAQALARVEGDHVVRVYSAGFHRGRPWIAMQFVDGPHLADWLRYQRASASPPGWQELLGKYVEAGRGLRSIHAAGFIHRDFKPQNAVVDADGRVKVLDFGLVTHDRTPVASARAEEARRVTAGLSTTNGLVGTLRYAAPEQFRTRDLDHRSDQFSFCVALYEALWGVMPLSDERSPGQHLAATDGRAAIVRPLTSDVPGWLAHAVLRGLAYRPEDRHPSMAALLHELTRDRHRGYKRAALVGVGVFVGAVAVALLAADVDAGALCLQHADAVDEVWRVHGDAVRAAIADEDAAAGVEAAVLAWADRWRGSYTAACADTHEHGASAELLGRRAACLGRAQTTLAAVLARAGAGDPGDVADAIATLPAPASCLDARLEGVAVASDPHTAAQVALAERELADAEAARLLGDYDEAAARARWAADAAAGHLPTRARAGLALGESERLRERHGPAADALGQAGADAAQAGDWALKIRVDHERVRLAALEFHDERAATFALADARAALHINYPIATDAFVARALWAEHHDMRGLVAYVETRYPDAVAAHGEALALWEAMARTEDVRRPRASSLLDRARALAAGGEDAAALRDDLAALDLEIEIHGEDHPSLAANYFNIAQDHLDLKDYPAALKAARRALDIDERHHGRGSQQASESLYNLATIHHDANELDTARDLAERAQQNLDALDGATAVTRADVAYLIAVIAYEDANVDAEPLLRRAAGLLAAKGGADARCDLALTHGYRGLLHLEQGRPADAAAALDGCERALADATSACPATRVAHQLRGRLAVAGGRLAEARDAFEAALMTDAPGRVDPGVRVDLVQVLCALDCSDPRIVPLARKARADHEFGKESPIVEKIDAVLIKAGSAGHNSKQTR